MRAWILAGALAATFSTAALAADERCVCPHPSQQQTGSATEQPSPGIGGSGADEMGSPTVGSSTDAETEDLTTGSLGRSGLESDQPPSGTVGPGLPTSDANPPQDLDQQPGIGGGGQAPGTGAQLEPPARVEQEPAGSAERGTLPPASTRAAQDPTTATAPEMPELGPRVTSPEGMGGVALMVGGGIEGFFGQTGDLVRPGPSWGVTVMGRPNGVLGLEFGYSGAVHEANEALYGSDVATGADIVRNGVNAAVSVGLPWPVQPYVSGGLGINRYSVRGLGPVVGMRNDTAVSLPLGAGVRTNLGPFTADARFGYNVGIDEDFATLGEFAGGNADRYQGTLLLGGEF